jgi:rfaE bifunctional protein nucleotidyltransferase chain/domain
MKEDTITVKEILNPNLDSAKRLIKSDKELKKIVTLLKNNGYKIVLTQGVWDLVHEGHAKYLEKAKTLGDILIVGVDSDELTKKRKGPNRPIVPEGERVRMISHLRYVDILTIRGAKEDIGDLIRLIHPDVLVVSRSTKDFTKKMKEEYSGVCGKIVDLNPQATTSTTARVRNLTIEGAEKLSDKIKKLADDFIQGIKDGRE